MKGIIEKIKGLYQFTIKDESASGLRSIGFSPLTFIRDKIGIGLPPNRRPKEKVHIGGNTKIDGSLEVNRLKKSRFEVKGQGDTSFIINEDNNVGIGTKEPKSKLSLRNGELNIFDTTSNLGAESLNDGNFDSTTNWESQGGFTINTTGEYAEFTTPTDTNYFEKINPGSFDLIYNPTFSLGSVAAATTSAGAAASSADDAGVYRWHTTKDWTIDGAKATFEHSTGDESLLQQKIRAKAQASTPGITRRFLKLTYTIDESTIADESGKFAIVLPGGSAQEIKKTSVGTHTHFIYTATSLPTTNNAGHIVPVQLYFNYTGTTSTSSGDKIVLSRVSLEELPGVLFQRTMAIDPVVNEYYKLDYNITENEGAPDVLFGTIFLNGGRFRASEKLNIHGGDQSAIIKQGTLSGDFIIMVTNSDADTFRITNLVYKKIQSRVTTSAGSLSIGGNLEIGAGAAATDYTLTFDGETNDGVITWLEDEDYFKFSKDISAGWHGDASTIKVLPRDFVGNEDAAGAAIHFDDTGTIGIIPSDADMELYAFVPIPVGKKATHVSVFGNNTRPVSVFESNVNSGTHTSKGSGNVGTEIDITDFNHSATNYLTIKINTNAVTNVIYGATVTIADIV